MCSLAHTGILLASDFILHYFSSNTFSEFAENESLYASIGPLLWLNPEHLK